LTSPIKPSETDPLGFDYLCFSDIEEAILLRLNDEQFNQISIEITDDGIITGDEWFDERERELQLDG